MTLLLAGGCLSVGLTVLKSLFQIWIANLKLPGHNNGGTSVNLMLLQEHPNKGKFYF